MLIRCSALLLTVTEVEEMKRQMEEELRKKEEELENLSKSYEQRMADAAAANKVRRRSKSRQKDKLP